MTHSMQSRLWKILWLIIERQKKKPLKKQKKKEELRKKRRLGEQERKVKRGEGKGIIDMEIVGAIEGRIHMTTWMITMMNFETCFLIDRCAECIASGKSRIRRLVLQNMVCLHNCCYSQYDIFCFCSIMYCRIKGAIGLAITSSSMYLLFF